MGAVKKVIALSSGMGEIEWTNSLDMDMAVPYSMSKAALNMAIAKFNAAYRKEGILFMAVSPGAVDSEDDGRGSNVPIEDVDGDLAQTLYPVRPWHKYRESTTGVVSYIRQPHCADVRLSAKSRWLN